MQRREWTRALWGCALALALSAAGCAGMGADAGWATLIDGDQGLANFDQVGDANWRAEGGLIVADKGKGGFLVTKASYVDFAIRAEFWADTDTNSGVFLRLSDPRNVTAANAYEVNIWDIRPEPKYGTGAIVDHAAVPVPIVNKAGGRWNLYEIEARGANVTVKLNGVTTAVMNDGTFKSGPIGLQFGPGVGGALGGPIKWRKVQVKAL